MSRLRLPPIHRQAKRIDRGDALALNAGKPASLRPLWLHTPIQVWQRHAQLVHQILTKTPDRVMNATLNATDALSPPHGASRSRLDLDQRVRACHGPWPQ